MEGLVYYFSAMDLYSKALQGIQEPEEWWHDSSIPLIPGFHLMQASLLRFLHQVYEIVRTFLFLSLSVDDWNM